MKTLDEYRKELEQDPKMRRKLKKLEEEYHNVEESLTEEELEKYGLVPGESSDTPDTGPSEKAEDTAASVLDSIARKI